MSSSLKAFPMELVHNAVKSDSKTGGLGNSFNEASDADLIKRIHEATELYPSLRSLSYRLASRRNDDGKLNTVVQIVEELTTHMNDSVAAAPNHERHDDWLDRSSKIEELAESAIRANDLPKISEAEAEMWLEGEAFMDTQKMIVKGTRPIGPQSETKPQDIEARVAKIMSDDGTSILQIGNGDTNAPGDNQTKAASTGSDFVGIDLNNLIQTTLPPLEWVIPQMLPVGAICSLAGASNVGKTRWLTSLMVALAVGDTARMGLPQCTEPITSMYIANEEHVLDIARRMKAAMRHHGDKGGGKVIVRGKDAGMLRLIGVNEIGQPEDDKENIAVLVHEIRQSGAKLVVLDPYITLSDAMDENSSSSAAALTKVFHLISKMTGAAVMHAHHTPKDRKQDVDWIRGSLDGWRGSGAIYSALDCAFTIANWMPRNGERRKYWKTEYLEHELSRFIVLDSGKVREGRPIAPVVMELVSQEMGDGEGDPIGVCKVITAEEAENVLTGLSVDMIMASELANVMFDRLGVGKHTNFVEIHKSMKGVFGWPTGDRLQSRNLEKLCGGVFTHNGIMANNEYSVAFKSRKARGTSGKWSIVIKETNDEVE
jgi:hypothetical protein